MEEYRNIQTYLERYVIYLDNRNVEYRVLDLIEAQIHFVVVVAVVAQMSLKLPTEWFDTLS